MNVSGYPFLMRLSLTALASLGPSAGALAGTIEGTIDFPSELVPSMTVYASELDTARVHSTQFTRGQANFTIEVPPGRYVLFSTPNEPGAPDIYGAYTEYSLCAPHGVEGKCEDHALITVAITAKAQRTTVTIDDWYLSDEVADQIDHIRGISAGGGTRFDSEPLSAPRFSEYPSMPFDATAPPSIDFDDIDMSEEDRAAVQQALSNGPNFAGHVTATLTPCGLGCGRLLLIDWQTGAVRGLPVKGPQTEIQGSLPCRLDEALVFRRDSRLLSVTRPRGTAVVTQYFVWNQKNAALVQSGEYQRTAQAFCAVAAP